MKRLFIFLIFLCGTLSAAEENQDYKIPVHLYNYIRTHWDEDLTILELGSGAGTGHLVQHYRVYSIEDDIDYLNLYEADYIYAPLRKEWYDRDAIIRFAPERYDLILVDGPRDLKCRFGFLENLDLFNIDVPILINDVQIPSTHDLLEQLSEKIGRPYKIYMEEDRAFGVI